MILGNLIGAIAQLGERLPCTQEVGGSIPPGSTIYLTNDALAVYRKECFITMKPSFLITGSDLLFNKLDEIEIPIIGFHYLRNSIISDSDFKRYPVLSLKWLCMTSSDGL